MSRYNDAAARVAGIAAPALPPGVAQPCAAPGCPNLGTCRSGGPWLCRDHVGQPRAMWHAVTRGLLGQNAIDWSPRDEGRRALAALRASLAPARVPGEDDE